MNHRNVEQLAGVVFAAAGLLHAVRVLKSLELTVGTWQVPMSLSVVAVVVTWFLAYQMFTSHK